MTSALTITDKGKEVNVKWVKGSKAGTREKLHEFYAKALYLLGIVEVSKTQAKAWEPKPN